MEQNFVTPILCGKKDKANHSASEVLETPVSTLLGETVVETEIDNLKAISEKLEVINLQLAQRKTTRRKILHWLLISSCAAIVIIFAF